MTTTQNRTLTPYFATRGKTSHRVNASEGGVRQQGSKPMSTCECGSKVVWLKSRNTGKFYLANCYRFASEGPTESWYYIGTKPHTCSAPAETQTHSVLIVAASGARMEHFGEFETALTAYDEAVLEGERSHQMQNGDPLLSVTLYRSNMFCKQQKWEVAQ